jgi:hypothetical protein
MLWRITDSLRAKPPVPCLAIASADSLSRDGRLAHGDERRSGAYAPLEQGCLTVGHCSGDLLLEGAGADELRQAECREWQLAWGANRTANQASNHVADVHDHMPVILRREE